MANSGDIRGKSSRCGVFGDTWQLGKNPGGEVFSSALGTRGGFRGRFEEGPKGFVRRRVERGFRRNGFGLTFGTGGTLRRAVRQGLRRSLRKEAFDRASRRLRRWEGSSGDTCQIPKGLRRRVVRAGGFERFSGGSFERWPSGRAFEGGFRR